MTSTSTATSHGTSTGARTAAPAAAGLAAGLVLGAATETGQGVLTGSWGLAVNSVSAWVVLAFAVSAACLGPRAGAGPVAAAVTGLAAMEGLVAGYYGWAAAVSGTPHASSSIAVWASAGAVGGPVAGAAAWAWRTRAGWLRAAGPGAVGAVLLSEGARAVATTPWLAHGGWVLVVLGVAAPLVLLPGLARLRGLVVAAAGAVVVAGGFSVLDRVVGW